MEMASQDIRERLERIVIDILDMASRIDLDPALRNELMHVADRISQLLDDP